MSRPSTCSCGKVLLPRAGTFHCGQCHVDFGTVRELITHWDTAACGFRKADAS